MFTENQWTFKTWLANFIEVDLPIGDLAKDVARDLNFPSSEEYNVLLSYLSKSPDSDKDVLEAFKTVWQFYQNSR